jgi:hypothetical protein
MNIRSRALLGWVAVIALSAALAACGDNGGPDLTLREITDEELSLMVLRRADLGEEYADLRFIEQSDFVTNETRVKWALDPEDEADDLERFDRLNGYEAVYVAFSRPTEEGGALDEIRLGVALFADAAGASDYLEDELTDIEQGIGGEHLGRTLEEVKRFKVGGIADRSVGFRARATAAPGQDSAAPTNITQVYFRRGRLLADVAIGRLDEEDASEAVQTLARELDERIQAVLRGEVTPVPD